MEHQMTNLTPEGPMSDNDDRLDANVWGLSYLMLQEQSTWRPL